MVRGCVFVLLAASWLLPSSGEPDNTAFFQGQLPAPQTPKNFKPFNDPAKGFSLDYPKDWLLISGTGDVVVTIAQNKAEAAVVVERQTLDIAPSVITSTFLNIEVADLKARQPDALNVIATMPPDRPRVLMIDYSRTGISGTPERLRQYSFPEGKLLLRVTFIAQATKFDRYLTQFFATIANSVTIPARAAGRGVLEQR